MRTAADVAEWWEAQHTSSKQILDQYVEDNPGLFSVMVATAAATAMQLGAGMVDVLRLGEGAAEGTLKGFGTDALRLIGIAGPLGKGAKLVQSARGARLARVIADPGGGICAWVASTKALRQTAQKAFAAVDDLLKALDLPALSEFPAIYTMRDVLGPLRRIGAEILEMGSVRTIAEVQRAVPRDGSVVLFFVKWHNTLKNQETRHALYAFYDYLGRFRIADRTGAVVNSLEELHKIVPGYGGIGSAVPFEMALIKNVFMKFIGPKGTATLAMEVLAQLAADPETVAQSVEVRKAAELPKPPTARYYTVQRGDSLSRIAQREYGDMYKWPVLYEANREVVGGNPDLIHPGQQLWIPELPKVSAVRR
jgi:LysM repeat protein